MFLNFSSHFKGEIQNSERARASQPCGIKIYRVCPFVDVFVVCLFVASWGGKKAVSGIHSQTGPRKLGSKSLQRLLLLLLQLDPVSQFMSWKKFTACEKMKHLENMQRYLKSKIFESCFFLFYFWQKPGRNFSKHKMKKQSARQTDRQREGERCVRIVLIREVGMRHRERPKKIDERLLYYVYQTRKRCAF